ncbi:Transmembrane amino acid transporter protein [Brugia malayi]|uniref:Transmembrane amino acid transporter protein n=1 Tax=Brugia malayi TaxID=6279 RepID=A0A7I4KNZ5_BRUMA|nr:Transmembrane amino acid transporter protein [Brugia malayi]VIO95145.1 Transmembrane amino acid transporter protein [Brugia malayi]
MYAALKKEEDRDDQRSIERSFLSKFNQWPHVFNLANCIVGVSMLAMPYCLQQCGILLGTILIGICSLLTKITCHLLYQGALLTRRRSYESMASHAFGSNGKRLVELLMILFLMSCVISFMVVIGDIGPHVLADYLELQAPTQRLRILVMVVIFLFVILPLSLFRSVTSLSKINSVTVFFYGLFVLRMLVECIPRIFNCNWSTDIRWWRQEGLLTSLPIISMALSCQTQLFCVTESITEPSAAKVDTVVSGAVNICSSMYAAVGLFGYVAFHDVELYGDILLYLQSSLLTQLMKLAFMLSVAVSIPLMLFPSRIAFYNLLKSDACEYAMLRMPSLIFVSLTVFLLSSCLLAAVIVPNVEFILGITGATIGCLVTIIIPSLLFLSISRGIEQYRALMFYAKVSIIIGSLMLIGSTWAVLHTEQETNVVDIILPKQIDNERVEIALKNLEKFKTDDNSTKLQNTFSRGKQNEETVTSREEKWKGKQNVGTVTNEETKTLLHGIKEKRKAQSNILKKQQTIADGPKKHKELMEMVTMTGIWKMNASSERTEEINV